MASHGSCHDTSSELVEADACNITQFPSHIRTINAGIGVRLIGCADEELPLLISDCEHAEEKGTLARLPPRPSNFQTPMWPSVVP
jgi:hypothetical protein